MMRESRFEGIIIGFENRGDADRLVSFYTPHAGKTAAVAKGIRYEKSKLKGHMDLLTYGNFGLAKNRGIGVVTDAVAFEDFSGLRTRAASMYAAMAVAAMYDNYLYPHDADPDLWELLCGTLQELSVERDDAYSGYAALVERFAGSFLKHLGYYGHPHRHDYVPAASGSEKETAVSERDVRHYDRMLAYTEISGPTFLAIDEDLRRMCE
jgi:DNA repair protein RecO